jgi:hypothetical protein
MRENIQIENKKEERGRGGTCSCGRKTRETEEGS